MNELISPNEVLARAIFHPLMFSKSKKVLKQSAFLPPADKKDVSVQRSNFINNEELIKIFLKIKINEQVFVGYACIDKKSILEVNNFEHWTINNERLIVDVVSAPLEGLPYHANIRYSDDYPKYNPSTGHRIIADRLIAIVHQNNSFIPYNN